jgi:hypothetical protein
VISPDSRFLFSAGTDGTMFIFAISEQQVYVDRNGLPIMLPAQTNALSADDDEISAGPGGLQIVDEALADIVLVRK